MKKTLFALLFLATALCTSAQKVYFIYMQSEKGTPFFVKMGEKVLPSNPSGYLILHSLKDTTYTFLIGYPGGQVSEARFSIALSNSDRGFLIKQLDDGLSLFDLQSLTLVRPLNSGNSGAAQQAVLRTDNFTILLSQVSDDASLMYAAAPRVEVAAVAAASAVKPKEQKDQNELLRGEPGIADVALLKPKDTIATTAAETKGIEKVNPPVVKPDAGETTQLTTAQKDEPPVVVQALRDTLQAARTVVKVADRKATGTGERSNNVEEQPKTPVEAPTAVGQGIGAPRDPVGSQKTEPERSFYKRSVITRRSESSTTEGFGLVFLDNNGGDVDTIRLLIPFQVRNLIENKSRVETPGVVVAPAGERPAQVEKLPLARAAGCSAIATDRDFLRLQRSMAAETNDERMIAHARKSFRAKCFTTEQVRNLSSLFLTSAAKYQFFDAAYLHVTDRGAFATLAREIKDEYYARRFQALIGE